MAYGQSNIVIENATYGRVWFKFQDIKSVIYAHVQQGNRSTNGPVLITVAGYNGPVTGDFQSMISFDPSAVPDLLEELRAGRIYFNTRTLQFPDGEIRGTYTRCKKMKC